MMIPNSIKKVDEKLKAVLKEHGIVDEKIQQEIIIKFIKVFSGR